MASYLGPRLSRVGGLEEAATGSVAGWVDAPRRPSRGPKGCEDHVCIGRIHGHVDRPDVWALVECLLPGLAAVSGDENAAHFIGAVLVAEGSDVHGVRVFGVDENLSDLTAVVEADMGPSL